MVFPVSSVGCGLVRVGVLLSFAVFAAGQPSLKTVPVPRPANLSRYVQDDGRLVILGKALFWDLQISSDGRIACATCHFHAGADHRRQNMLSNPTGSFPPNYSLTAADFPFHQRANPTAPGGVVLRDTSRRTASSGVFRRSFIDVVTGASVEQGSDVADSAGFRVGSLNVRQSGGRNTPTVINAVFNYKNLWDGRASNIFTGVTPFGASDTRANVLSSVSGALVAESIRLENSSLASQAVGPPLNDAELAFTGRNWPKLGKKVLALRPLARQKIASDDSVLGALANPGGKGLASNTAYLDLVKAAFQPAYWNSSQLVDSDGRNVAGALAGNSNQFTQAEYNFAIFFGLAIQAYEATLVSDDSPFDRFAEGQTGALSAEAQAGQRAFNGTGQCDSCHERAEFTEASVTEVTRNGPTANGGLDTGFFRTNVRPAAEDSGLGGIDDFGKPFSTAVANGAATTEGVGGMFKTPGLRNVEFTGPFMHNGGQSTLEQVLEFYTRGGDFPEAARPRGRALNVVNLNANDRAQIVTFLKALSDERVRFERAPFDHPELCVPTGHATGANGVLQAQTTHPGWGQSAADLWAGVPAVGRNGNAVPLQTFEELLLGIGADGSRAHHLGDACQIAEPAPPMTVAGAANAASGGAGIAPGMALSLYGFALASLVETASNLPLPRSLAGLTATVNGVAAPLYYASSGQVNLQVPYETQPGSAVLVVGDGVQSMTTTLPVAAAAPGIFTSGASGGSLIPRASAARGETIALFMTGEGQVTPALATGETPAAGTPLANLPKPRLAVSVTVGGLPAAIQFIGIPSGLAGVTQVNFQVPADAPPGSQNVVVTVGGVSSSPARLTVQQ